LINSDEANVCFRFNDIAWSQPTADRKQGVIAGALENGALDVWDAEKLRTGATDSLIARTIKHSGAIKALQFNNFKNELLATAGAKGELYIWDLNNIQNPFKLGASVTRADDFECLDWNKGEKVPHILATGSNGGFVTVWDVRGKKENLTLNNLGRKPVSAVCWDPSVATRLITAIPNDQDPLILVWDLRNSNAPERTLQGHELGVLSLDWCRQDPSLLLSCGKDNRTVCWNPHSGQAYGDYPIVTNWTFQTRWNPHNPDMFAVASFDGKITIQNIQNTNSKDVAQKSSQPSDGEDFFAQTQSRPQGPSFSLPNAPIWQKRPVGASFGFGGKLIRYKQESGRSVVTIDNFAVDDAISEIAESFEKELSSGDISALCERKITESTNDEEKADWTVIDTLNTGKSRQKLTAYLGIDQVVDAVAPVSAIDDDDDFFTKSAVDQSSGNFLAGLASKGARTNAPFSLHTDNESEADRSITSALIMGNFDKALDICLADERLSDAFMIAICGGQKSIDKVQRAYLKKKADGPSYLRLLSSIIGKNLWDVVHNADLAHWKETMAALCTFSEDKEFPDLCEALGDRLEEAIITTPAYRRDASFCYLAGSKLEKVIRIWVQELKEREAEGLKEDQQDSDFSLHARSLQDFIEKVTVFRRVTNFQDVDKTSTTDDWKLAALYEKYIEYADILASHGQLQTAQKYLDLLPSKYGLAEIAQQRVQRATGKSTQSTATTALPGKRATTMTNGMPQTQLPGLGNQFSSSQQRNMPGPQAVNGMPQTQALAGGATLPYAPLGNPYAPTGYTGYQPVAQQYIAQASPRGSRRSTLTKEAPPPPPKDRKDETVWNDTPDNFFKPPPTATRKSTPATNTSSYTPSGYNTPTPNNMLPPPKQAPLPPPPKAGQSISRVTSPPANIAVPARPPSAAANAYAPPQSAISNASGFGSALPTPDLRGPLSYQQSPSGPPSNDRYAPTPIIQNAPSVTAPPPPRAMPPPPNPYTRAPSSNYSVRPPVTTPPQPTAPPSGPPMRTALPPPPMGPSRQTSSMSVTSMPPPPPPVARTTSVSPAPVNDQARSGRYGKFY